MVCALDLPFFVTQNRCERDHADMSRTWTCFFRGRLFLNIESPNRRPSVE